MEIKQGAGNIQLFLKPRLNEIVIPMQTWATLYGEADFLNGTYEILLETADKTGSEIIASSSEDADGMFFILPAALFSISQRTWTVILKFTLNGKTDFSLYNFDIKVTKGDSMNSR